MKMFQRKLFYTLHFTKTTPHHQCLISAWATLIQKSTYFEKAYILTIY